MRHGEARIAEQSKIDSMLERRWSHRKPVRQGFLYTLTVLFWGLWAYLVLPLFSLLLWFLGVRLFMREMLERGGYQSLLHSLVTYSLVLVSIIVLLLFWIFWNMARYGGSKDRRTAKGTDVSDGEVAATYRLDSSLLPELRSGRLIQVDVDRQDCVVLTGKTPARSA